MIGLTITSEADMCSHSHCKICGSARPVHAPKCAAVSPQVPQGWQCPKCMKIHAPFVVGCSCQPDDYSWAIPTVTSK